MSWHYLQEQAAEYSEGICSGGEPWRPSKLKTIHGLFSCNGSLTDTYLDSLSGTMCEPLTGVRGMDELISSPGGFPVRIFPLPGRAPASKENGLAYGQKWPVLLAKYDLDTLSWKTAQCSLLGDLEPLSETWPRWGMMQDGVSWELTTPEHLTNGTESGFWRSPDTGAGGTSGLLKEGKDYRENGQPIQVRLVDQVTNPRLWPTIRSTDGERGGRGDLIQAVRGNPNSHYKTWPTPTKSDGMGGPGSSGREGGENLRTAVGGTSTRLTYPTPRANDAEKRGNIANDPRNGLPAAVKYPTPTNSMVSMADMEQARTAGNSGKRPKYQDAGSGQLNPNWVEWLMGWPIGWTDLKPLETDRFRQRWLSHFRYYPKD